jgi:hypothetical protein
MSDPLGNWLHNYGAAQVSARWTELHNEGLHSVTGVIKSRRVRWAEHVTCMTGIRNAHRILVGRHEGKSVLGIPRRRSEVKVKGKVFPVLN